MKYDTRSSIIGQYHVVDSIIEGWQDHLGDFDDDVDEAIHILRDALIDLYRALDKCS